MVTTVVMVGIKRRC